MKKKLKEKDDELKKKEHRFKELQTVFADIGTSVSLKNLEKIRDDKAVLNIKDEISFSEDPVSNVVPQVRCPIVRTVRMSSTTSSSYTIVSSTLPIMVSS